MLRDPRAYRGQRFIKCGGVIAARLSKIGPPAALTADLFSHWFNEIAGLNLANVVLAYTSRQVNFAAINRTQHDDRALQFVLKPIDCIAQR